MTASPQRKPKRGRNRESHGKTAHAGPARSRANLLDLVRELYEGTTQRGYRFRYMLLAFDVAVILFIVISSFVLHTAVLSALGILIGLAILADLTARIAISQDRLRDLLNPVAWADAASAVSFLAPLAGGTAGFLRVLRTVRLLHTYQMLVRLRRDSRFFRRHEDVLVAVTHLTVFVFVMTAIVYEAQHRFNPEIANYVDALYFTVSSLTTTGYGDIVLSGTAGRFLSVAIMIIGVTLFFRLARAVLQPGKVRFPCPACGLQRHDADAVHCKACGTVLNIPDEGRT